MKRFLPWIGVAGVALIALVTGTRIDLAQRARLKAENAALREYAKGRDAVIGRLRSERKIVSSLPPALKEFARKAVKASPRSKVDSSLSTTIKIEDTAKTVEAATPAGQSRVCDEYGRFCFDLPSGLLTRRQLFKLDTVFVRSVDGKTRVSKSEFWEFDPTTREVIPTKGVDLTGDFQFMDEVPGAPSIFHLRPLIAVDHRGAIGAGVEFLNFERTKTPILKRLTLSVIGYWDRKSDEGRAVAQLGYRLFGNLTAGPYLGLSSNGTQVFGAGFALQVGR